MESFIHVDTLKDLSVCDDLIQYYKKTPKTKGIIADGENNDFKRCGQVSIDLMNNPPKEYMYYISQLKKVKDDYIEKYEFCNAFSSWNLEMQANIQYYAPTEGYYGWHCERDSLEIPYSQRHLVYMTYLNDVTDEGETEWFYQKTKIQPRKGLTVIWPADWTHTHRGVPSMTQEKYIITGWYQYTE